MYAANSLARFAREGRGWLPAVSVAHKYQPAPPTEQLPGADSTSTSTLPPAQRKEVRVRSAGTTIPKLKYPMEATGKSLACWWFVITILGSKGGRIRCKDILPHGPESRTMDHIVLRRAPGACKVQEIQRSKPAAPSRTSGRCCEIPGARFVPQPSLPSRMTSRFRETARSSFRFGKHTVGGRYRHRPARPARCGPLGHPVAVAYLGFPRLLCLPLHFCGGEIGNVIGHT